MNEKKEKVHRVRLTDKEIKAIAEGLKLLREKAREEATKNGIVFRSPEYARWKFLEDLAHRFRSWGHEYYGERPYYARPRR